jgi:hypothetical protein
MIAKSWLVENSAGRELFGEKYGATDLRIRERPMGTVADVISASEAISVQPRVFAHDSAASMRRRPTPACRNGGSTYQASI